MGGVGGCIAIQTKITAACAFISSSRFCPAINSIQFKNFNHPTRANFVVVIDWTCSAGEECRATTEITRSLQIDLLLSDTAATSEP